MVVVRSEIAFKAGVDYVVESLVSLQQRYLLVVYIKKT